MSKQTDINAKMRSILFDWLVEVHLKFKLVPETLFMTCGLIDRYLEKEQVMRDRLQLVGIAAMFIASKYEEIFAPEYRSLVESPAPLWACRHVDAAARPGAPVERHESRV